MVSGVGSIGDVGPSQEGPAQKDSREIHPVEGDPFRAKNKGTKMGANCKSSSFCDHFFNPPTKLEPP